MKKWLICSLILVAILMLLPYGVGVLAEREIYQRQTQINQHMQKTLMAEMISYHRGWWSSRATLKLRIQANKLSDYLLTLFPDRQIPAEEGFTMVYDVKIKHGPVMFNRSQNATSALQFGIASLSADCDLSTKVQARQQPLYHFDSLVHFTGSTSSHIYSANVNFTDKQQDLQMVWNGLQADAEVSKDFDRLKLKMHLSPIKAGNLSHITQIQTGDFHLTANLHRDIEDFWIGQVNFNLPSLQINSNHKPILAIKNMQANTQQSLQNQKVSSSYKYSINEIVLGKSTYGPTVFSLTMSDLSASYLRAVSDLIYKNNLQIMTREQLAFFGMQLVPNFLGMIDGASLQLSLLSKAPEGLINVNLNVETAKQNNKKVDALAMAMAVQGAMQIVAPKELVIALLTDHFYKKALGESFQKMTLPVPSNLYNKAQDQARDKMQIYVKEGWIMEDKNNFKSDFHYQGGRLIANGVTKYDLLNQSH